MPRKPFVPPPPREKRSRASKDAAPKYSSLGGMPADEPPKKKGRAWGNAAKNCTSAFRGVTGKPGAIRRPLDRKRSARREGNFYRRTQASGRRTSRCRTRRRSTSAPSRRRSTPRARSTRNAARSATGQDKGDSTSLQRECSARARSGKSIHASRTFQKMIARPKISRNELKLAERGAFEVGNFAPFSCPGPRAPAPQLPRRERAGAEARRARADVVQVPRRQDSSVELQEM